MKSEELIPLLHDYHLGRLDEATSARIRALLGEDQDARELSEAWLVLRDGLAEGAASEDHPTSEQLVEHALQAGPTDASERGKVDEHLRQCAICRDDVERTREANARVAHAGIGANGRSPARTPHRRTRLVAALAAAAAIAVLAYPAYIGLVRYPSLRRQHSLLQGEARDAQTRIDRISANLDEISAELGRLQDRVGPVALQLLASGIRGSDQIQKVRIAEDQPLVLLGIELGVPAAVSAETILLFEAVRAEGEAVPLGELPTGATREQIRSTGVVTILLPATQLDGGRYRMRVRTKAPAEEMKLFDASFVVELEQ